jgi:two-component system, LytTR family, sensor kinase
VHAAVARSLPWDAALKEGFVDVLSLTLVCLVAVWMAWRFPIDPRRPWRRIALHLAAGAGFAILRVLLALFLWHSLVSPSNWQTPEVLVGSFPTSFAIYLLMLGAGLAIVYFQRTQQSALAASRLEAEVADAQIGTLTRQLQPAFLFDALHLISREMKTDVRRADRAVAALGELLRTTLHDMDEPLVALEDELSALEPYVQIARMRTGGGVDIAEDLAPGTEAARVPRMILRPVLDALLAADRDYSRPARVTVGARWDGPVLCLEICQRFPGGKSAAAPLAASLRPLRDRLRAAGDAPGDVEVREGDGNRWVRIRLPRLLEGGEGRRGIGAGEPATAGGPG